MHILFVSRGFPTDKYPLNGIFEFDQAKAIASLGHKVTFASLDMRSVRRWRKWGIEKFEKDGILVYGINYPLGRVPKKVLTHFTVKGLQRLYRKIEKESGRPDIVHAHFTGIGYAAAKLKEITGLPLIITEHSSAIMKSQIDERLKEEAIQTYSKADRVIVVSPALGEVIKTNFNIDTVYIPNVVDTNIFRYKGQKDKSDFTFITVGNLIYIKCMDLTIKAFDEAFKNKEKVKLIVVGEGEERKKIENIIKEYGLKDKVVLKGRLARKEIANLMSESDCFVLPSRAETFGVVYIEAMAAGLPFIATRCGGPEGFANEGNGIMIDVDNLYELIDAMEYMYNNIDKYDRKSISMKTIQKFSPEIVAREILKVYQDILNH